MTPYGALGEAGDALLEPCVGALVIRLAKPPTAPQPPVGVRIRLGSRTELVVPTLLCWTAAPAGSYSAGKAEPDADRG